jgi:Glycosyl transferase WecG/TagA/CpsF family
MQKAGCEWLYRLCAEPRRMWRRYLIGNFQFASIVLQQRIRRTVLSSLVGMLNKSTFAAELEETLMQTRTLELMSRLARFQTGTK